LAAIFPVAGVNILRPCPGAEPTTIVAFHGTADPVIPYLGGAPFSGLGQGLETPWVRQQMSPAARAAFARIRLAPVEEAVAGWATELGCGSPTDVAVAADVRLRSFGPCRDGAGVSLHTVEGGGHTWPGSPTDVARLGATSCSIDATRIIVDTVGQLAR
jgi:polyhydroxybutyrate depolymerase